MKAPPPVTRDPAIQRLYTHLGPVTVLVEVEPGQPRFRLAAAGLPTLAASRTEPHQLCLAEGGVAVALGAASDGLHALVFADKVKLAKFIAGNPGLRGACHVEHPHGTAILVRVDGPAPASRVDDDFVWLSDDSTLTVLMRAGHGWHAFPPGKPPAHVPRVRLDTLDWRPLGDFGLALLRDVLAAQHGVPVRTSRAAQGRLNLRFWTAFLARTQPLRYHARRRQFQQRPAGAPRWDDVSPVTVAKLAGEAVLATTIAWCNRYQPTPWEAEQLVTRLRQATSQEVMDEEQFFAACLQDVVERCAGANVTTKEVLALIERMHRKAGVTMPSATSSARRLKRLMQEQFGIPRSNNGCPESGASPFLASDFTDLQAVVAKLKQPMDAVSSYLRDQFSDATREALPLYGASQSEPAQLLAVLAEEFNQVVRGELIFDDERFGAVTLRPATKRLIAKNSKNPQGYFLTRLNRSLLEDAFPQGLKRQPAWGRGYQGVRLKPRTAEFGGGLDALDTSTRNDLQAQAVATSTPK